MQLDPELKRIAQREADAVLADLAGVSAVVIATVDGFDVAHATTRAIDSARVAALASSISAIGLVVSQETQLGRIKSLTINTDDGFAYFSTVQRGDVGLVVNILCNGSAVLAQVAYRCSETVKRLQ